MQNARRIIGQKNTKKSKQRAAATRQCSIQRSTREGGLPHLLFTNARIFDMLYLAPTRDYIIRAHLHSRK